MRLSLRRLALAMAFGLCTSGTAAAQTCSGAPTSTRLLISVDGVRNARGFVVGNLYPNDKQRYLVDNGWIAVWREPARPGSTVLCQYLPAPGYYEVVVFHDANGNGVLDQGPFGIPEEGYGFSNNVRPFLRAPSMKSAQFLARAGDTWLRIRLHYP